MSPAARAEWREHWPVVVSAMVSLAACHAHVLSLGVMIGSLEKEFGWSRAEITSGLFAIALVLFPLSPVMGIAIDRFGPRRIALWGVAIYCLSVASLSLAQPAIWSWWLLWLFVACGCLFVTPTVWVSAITSLFFASRGLAFAMVLSGTGLMAFAGPLLTYVLVDHFGWRMAYVMLGGGTAAIALPILYLFFSSAKDRFRTRSPSDDGPAASLLTGKSLPEGIKSMTFVRLVTAGPIMTIAFTAFVVNVVPILVSSGLTMATAAAIAGVVGVSQITGRLMAGYLVDRFNARLVGAAVVLCPMIASLMLMSIGSSVLLAAVAVFIYGLAIGAELDVLAYLASRSFGARNFGALFGVIVGFCSLGAGIGPILGSLAYDYYGSYHLLLWAIVPLCLLSSYCFFTVAPYPSFDDEQVLPAKAAE